MKVLVLGSGSREHALAWKLAKSPGLTSLVVAPGNPGIARRFETAPVDPTSPQAVVALAKARGIDLVVVGPEAPLAAGVADALVAANLPVFGPAKAAARIEASKAFAKEIMLAARVPTARTEVFDDVAKAAARARAGGAIVVKADGLAAGKGVVVADDGAQAAAAVEALGALPSGERILLEERLTGPEVSVMALCDGERFVLLPASQDHKRLLDDDRGPNTGGMGAVSTGTLVPPAELERLGALVIAPVLNELRARGAPFVGALYAGLMLTPEGPKVLEYNCRLGDPETQVLMLQTKSDLLPVLHACARGALRPVPLELETGASVGVVVAAAGYPEKPKTGGPISLHDVPGLEVFFAGVAGTPDQLRSSGGRVLTVAGRGVSVAAARAQAYRGVAQVTLEGAHWRTDIGARALGA